MIDKTKTYRFRGDSERWAYHMEYHALVNEVSSHAIAFVLAERFSERGLLLEYPELPGEDWEFCEEEPRSSNWCDGSERWVLYTEAACPECSGIYCRKKKPAYRRGVLEGGQTLVLQRGAETTYWTTDPEKGKELLK